MNRTFCKDILKKWKFSKEADRIGPDMPFTHWKLHFPSSMKSLCKRKFKKFSETSDFRPGAYAVHCSNIEVGENVIIRPGTMIFADEYAEVKIENDVMLGSGIHFYVNNHKFESKDIPLIEQGYYPSSPIVVEKGAWIGANSIVLPGVTIGKNCVIGAGSVVTRSIPDYCIAVGNPAKVVRKIV
ncbi:acyltransferase [Vibrio splendidus]|uniref:acyltransferase n=1 Tax=Vibrio splendidus TaxID=29497 RepID=UPI003D0A8A27